MATFLPNKKQLQAANNFSRIGSQYQLGKTEQVNKSSFVQFRAVVLRRLKLFGRFRQKCILSDKFSSYIFSWLTESIIDCQCSIWHLNLTIKYNCSLLEDDVLVFKRLKFTLQNSVLVVRNSQIGGQSFCCRSTGHFYCRMYFMLFIINKSLQM